MNRPVGTAAGTAENPLGTDGGRRPALHTSIAVGFGLLALVQVIATRLSWVGIPLQTDTGIWAYIGGRILDGALPYRDLWESKPPGIFYLFALVERLFGIGRDGPLLWLDALNLHRQRRADAVGGHRADRAVARHTLP